MASQILGLFASPELYQQQQGAIAREEAAQYAAMNPYERITFDAALGGRQFGRALGGLLGGEDPQLRLISARQQAMQNLDPSNPDAILRAAQQLADMGDQQGALTLADYARKAQSELALVTQRTREARAAATPKELRIARERAVLQDQIAQLEAMPPSPERDRTLGIAKNTLAGLPGDTGAKSTFGENREAKSLELYDKPFSQLTTAQRKEVNDAIAKPEKEPSFGVDREAAAQEVYGRSFAQLSQTEKAAINKRVEEEKGRVAEKTAPKFMLPGQSKDGAKDIPAFRDKVIGTIDPFRKTVTAADSAIDSLKNSIETNNFAAFRAAQTQFARAISGAGDLSQKELKAAGADPSLIGGGMDYLSTLATATPSRDTQEKLRSALRVLRKVAVNKARNELDAQRKIAKRAGFNEDDIKLIFDFPEFELAPAAPKDGKPAGGVVRKKWSDLP